MKRNKLEVLKVDPLFKKAFKLEASKSGCVTLAEYTRSLAGKMATRDSDVADLICNSKNKGRKSHESFFRI